jgi:hypothetical protein
MDDSNGDPEYLRNRIVIERVEPLRNQINDPILRDAQVG